VRNGADIGRNERGVHSVLSSAATRSACSLSALLGRVCTPRALCFGFLVPVFAMVGNLVVSVWNDECRVTDPNVGTAVRHRDGRGSRGAHDLKGCNSK
jgi:hypothetical protein